MAIHRKSLLNGTINHKDDFTFFAPYSIADSNTTQNPQVLHMLGSFVGVICGVIRVPENYVGTPKLSIFWNSETTTGDVDFKFRHRTVGDGEDLGISTSPTELEDTQPNNTGPGTAAFAVLDSFALATTDLTAGQLMYFEFERDGVTDTKADSITVWALDFEYSDA